MSLFSFALAQAAVAPAAAQQPGSVYGTLVPFAFMAIIFYFLLIRPQQKRAKEQAALVSSVKSGDEVVVNGMHGIVSNARDAESKTVLVKFAENVKIEVDRSAISNVTKASTSGAKEVPLVKVN